MGGGSSIGRVCAAVALVALIVGAGATFMPVDRCGTAWKAALDPERSLVYDGSGPGGVAAFWPGTRDPGAIFRSVRYCREAGQRRLMTAAVGAAMVVVSAGGVGLMLGRPRR